MKLKIALAVGMAMACVGVAGAFEVRQVFERPQYTRGNVNVRILRPIDEAAWVWMPAFRASSSGTGGRRRSFQEKIGSK